MFYKGSTSIYFVGLVMEKVVLALESLFWPANGIQSTCLLVKIYNSLIKMRLKSWKKPSKKAYFEQQTQCTALIYWSKYTATGFKLFQNQIETNIVP